MKPRTSYGARIGTLALAAQMLVAACMPPFAFAQEVAAPRRGEPITLNFTNAEIESVARTMAVVTGRDVVVDPRVKGTITLQTDRAISPEAAFNQFAAALRLQGFSIVQSEGLYKVVPEADAKLQSSAVTTSTPTSSVGGNQILTQVFKLNYESANNLLPVLRPLIAPNNTINVNPGNNSLVITDYAENMRRLARIIAALDVPNASDIDVIQLRHSVATDMVPLVTRLLEGGAATGGGVPGAAPGTADASFRTTLLADPRGNSIIVRAANPARAQLVRTLIDKLDRAPLDTGNGAAGNVYVVYLKNADAVRLAVTLRAAIAVDARGGAGATGTNPSQGGAAAQATAAQVAGNSGSGAQSPQATAPVNNANQPSTGGQIQADPSTNSLIITASEPQYRQIRAVIDKLDGRRAQVMIEALIVEVNATKAAQFGVQWQSALGNNGVIGTNSSLSGPSILALTGALIAKTPATSAAALASIAGGLNLGGGSKVGGQFVLNAIANFFSSDADANLLSTPNLLTLDNEEAKIVIGQNVPFVTGSFSSQPTATGVNPFTTIERKDVGLTLRVRPQINENGTVKMTVFQETSTVQAGTENAANGPTTNKRSIESSVLVEDGGLVMLGGLLSDNYSNNMDGIPLASDIPVLGNLFKSQNRNRVKSNLMMFLRPVVMRDAATTAGVSNERYEMMRSLQQEAQPANTAVLSNVSGAPIMPALPDPRPIGGNEAGSLRTEGAMLIPPPVAPIQRLGSSPLKGALPPTADPASSRELP
jgi:general secretion pathway protein D